MEKRKTKMNNVEGRKNSSAGDRNETPWTPLSSALRTFPDGSTSQVKGKLVLSACRELAYLFFTDVIDEVGVPDGENIYLTMLIDYLDGRFSEDELFYRMDMLQQARVAGFNHGNLGSVAAMEVASVCDVFLPRGCDGYDLRHRRLKISASAVEKAFGHCSHSTFLEIPEMDAPEGILPQCKRLASFVAKEATEPNTLASVAAWLIVEGIGGLVSEFEFHDKANKIFCLIDRIADGGDFVDTFLESALLSDLLFTPTYEKVSMLIDLPDGPKSLLKCLKCGGLFVGGHGLSVRRVFAGSLAKKFAPVELLKWKSIYVDVAAECPFCHLSATSIYKQWERKELARPFLSPTGQLVQLRTSV
jgi:hypothetical protein